MVYTIKWSYQLFTVTLECNLRVMKLFWYTIYTLYCDLQQEKSHFFFILSRDKVNTYLVFECMVKESTRNMYLWSRFYKEHGALVLILQGTCTSGLDSTRNMELWSRFYKEHGALVSILQGTWSSGLDSTRNIELWSRFNKEHGALVLILQGTWSSGLDSTRNMYLWSRFYNEHGALVSILQGT